MEWKEINNTLVKEFKFVDFIQAMVWMNKAAIIIEDLNHHPTWTNTYNSVQVVLTTHDAGNTVTEKDRQLAVALDALS
jgi:4a-hydroxytetrahydrobiopterin dehydratase